MLKKIFHRHYYTIRCNTTKLDLCNFAVKEEPDGWHFRQERNGNYTLELDVYTKYLPMPKLIKKQVAKLFWWSLNYEYQRYLKKRFNWKEDRDGSARND